MSDCRKVQRRALLSAGAAVAGLTVSGFAGGDRAAAVPRDDGSWAGANPPDADADADAGSGRDRDLDPGAALARLLRGNRRFVAGLARHPRQSPADLRRVAVGQRPFAVVLGCADSRAPAEVLFDQGIGDIFDNRVAGHVLDDTMLGSIEYAVAEFAPAVLLVLGHERCGAVLATFEVIDSGVSPPGRIRALTDALRPVLTPLAHRPRRVERGVRAHARAVAAALQRSPIVAPRVAAGSLAVVPARYDLDVGRVTVLP